MPIVCPVHYSDLSSIQIPLPFLPAAAPPPLFPPMLSAALTCIPEHTCLLLFCLNTAGCSYLRPRTYLIFCCSASTLPAALICVRERRLPCAGTSPGSKNSGYMFCNCIPEDDHVPLKNAMPFPLPGSFLHRRRTSGIYLRRFWEPVSGIAETSPCS